MAIQRDNAGIQRAKGLLEIAAGLYDSSLSYQTRRAAENVLQTDTDLGRVLRLSLGTKKSETRPEVTISFATGSKRDGDFRTGFGFFCSEGKSEHAAKIRVGL